MELHNDLSVPDVIDDKLRFLINIFVPKEGAAQVRSCEVTAKRCRNRTSFTNARGLGEIFTPRIADGVQQLLDRLSGSVRVISLPEHRLETTGLLLAGIQLISTYAKDGSAMITVRFKHLIGSIHHAFQDMMGLTDCIAETRDHLALQVLSDISMPLLDLCSFAEFDEDVSASRTTRLQSITERAGEIRFQVELIKRYILSLDREVIGATVREIPDDQFARGLSALR